MEEVNRSEASALLICLDTFVNCDWNGRLYIRSRTEPEPFSGVLELLEKMESFYDGLDFPQASTVSRSFQAAPARRSRPQGGRGFARQNERQPVAWSEQEMKRERGLLATFLVRTRYRQSSTWQGQIIWMEKDEHMPFCSTLEMLRRIESALGAGPA